MIQYNVRDLGSDERHRILLDYDRIMADAGVPQQDFKKYSLAAEEEGQLIGHVSGLVDHRWLMLSDLWVESSRRHHGLGSSLLKAMEEMVREKGIEHIYLWTYGPENRSFYEKNGYQEFAVFENYYEVEGYHQIGFRKDL